MPRKVAVVTGSNKGIGLSIVRALCQKYDGDVYLTARDESRGQEAVQLLKKEGLNPKFHTLDIESLESIKKFRDFLKKEHDGLDVLVNNAGMAYKQAATEPFSEQAEVTSKVNFWGTMNICNELFPLLRPHARVVNISSVCGFLQKIRGDEPQSIELRKRLANPKLATPELESMIKSFIELTKTGTHVANGWPNSAYDVSKVAVSALTRIQQREIDESRPSDDIVINSVHPGYVDTDMTSHKGVLTPEQGAVAAVWCATLAPNVKDPRGGYIWHDKTIVDWVNGPLPSAY